MFAIAPRSIRAAAVLLLTLMAALASAPASRVHASTPVWQDLFGGPFGSDTGMKAVDVAVDAQGFAYVAGTATRLFDTGTAVHPDVFLRKYDASTGAVAWTARFGGLAAGDEGHGVAVSGTDVYVTGRLNGRMFLGKFAWDGTQLWRWTLSDDFGSSRGLSVAVDPNGIAYVAGEGSVQGRPRGILVRVNASGVSDLATFVLAGAGLSPVALTSVALTSGGRLVFGGYAEGLVEFGGAPLTGSYTGGRDAFVIQIDPGSLGRDWGVQFGTIHRDEVTSVVTDTDGSVVVVGLFNAPGVGVAQTANWGSFIRKYDPAGVLSWSHDFFDSGRVRRVFCDAAINPFTHSVNVVGMNEHSHLAGRELPCRAAQYTASDPPDIVQGGLVVNQHPFINSFEPDGNEIRLEPFEVLDPFATWSVGSAFGAVQLGDGLIIAGNTQTFDFAVNGISNFGFVTPRTGMPVGLPEVQPSTTSVTVIAGQTATITGTFENPNGGPINMSVFGFPGPVEAGTLTKTDGSSGTWSWSIDTTVVSTRPYSLRANDGDFWQSIIELTVIATQPRAPVVLPFTNAVVVAAGQTATMTGTYEGPNGVTPTLTPSIGTLTQSGAEAGTWSWSFPTTSPADSQVVFITATDGFGGGTGAFQLIVQSPAAPTLAAAHSTVTVAPGQTATNSGLYLNASGGTPTLTASAGTVTRTGEAKGTWSWSLATDAAFEGTTVTMTASDGGPAGTVSFDVVARNATIDIESSGDYSIAGEPVTFSATVAPVGAGAPTGTVKFVIDGAAHGSPVPLVNGAATIEVDALAVGSHLVQAIYGGDAALQAGAASLTHVVVPEALLHGGAWQQQFGDLPEEKALATAVDASGNVYVAGVWNGRAFLRKFDATGAELWTDVFNYTGNDIAYDVAIDAQGRVYIVGATTGAVGSQSIGGRDAFVRQYDADGSPSWTRQFGSNADDIAYSVAVDGAGRVVVAGTTHGQLPGQINHGGVDAFVRQYDTSGALTWTSQFGSNTTDELFGVAIDASGRIVAVGYTGGALPGETPRGSEDNVLLAQFTASGTMVELGQFGSPYRDRGHGVAIDGSGGFYVVGFTEGALPGQTSLGGGGDAFVRKYDLSGVEQWTRQFGTEGRDLAYGVAADAAGNVVVVGSTESGAFPGFTASGSEDVFAQAFTGDGSAGTAWQFGSLGTDVGQAVAIDPVGQAIVAGYTTLALPGQAWGGSADAFVVRLVDQKAPIVTAHPASQAVLAGDTVSFSANATGMPWPSVQWQVSDDGGATFGDIPGAEARTFTLTAALADDGHQYRVAFANTSGTVVSAAAALVVVPDSIPPEITVPAGVTVDAVSLSGAIATFSASAVDNVAAPVTLSCEPPSGSMFPVGTTTVTCTATDGSGNTASASFPVVVLPDRVRPSISASTGFVDAMYVQSPGIFSVEASDVFGVVSVTINGVSATRVSGSPQAGTWQATVPVTVGAPTFFEVNATDSGGNVAAHLFVADGDGIAAAIDRDPSSSADQRHFFSSGIRNGLTFGTILTRGGSVMHVDEVPGVGGVLALLSGTGGGLARIAACGTNKEIWLDASQETARWSCTDFGSLVVTAVVARPEIVVRKTVSISVFGPTFTFAYESRLGSGQGMSTGSPVTADPGNTEPIEVTILDAAGQPVGSFSVDPGESADVRLAPGGNGGVDLVLEVLEGEVAFTVNGETTTLAKGDPPVTVDPDAAPPVIAPPDAVTAEAASAAGANVGFVLPAISDDTDPSPTVSVSHESGSLFPLGDTTVTITAVDDAGNSANATFVVTVQDTTPPALVLPEPIVAEAAGPFGANFDVAVTATDIVDASVEVVCSNADNTFPLGTTVVNCTATDDSDNVTMGSFSVTVRDTTAPSIAALTLSNGGAIWPPNGKMVSLTVSPTVTDAVSVPVCEVTSVVSSEAAAGRGRRAGPDWTITGPVSVELRAERAGNGPGRVYTLTVTCSDDAGNATSGTVTATVPYDRRN